MLEKIICRIRCENYITEINKYLEYTVTQNGGLGTTLAHVFQDTAVESLVDSP
jgi:hypothetical protein